MTVVRGQIHLEGVGKRYRQYRDTPTLAHGILRAWGRSTRTTLWAVRDVDLDIHAGEAVGVVGRNGSGKSTLLQMLCGVTAPTVGSVSVTGRVAPLISVGVGFHPELTGRENIFVNGSVLGLSRKEIERQVDAIIDFSEIEAFIDTPVKFYSSGMYVRLGFAVAAHVSPDVLLIDEVLAVGDQAFQFKCLDHMQKLRSDGTTVVLVSHNIPSVERFCDRAVVMSRGEKIFDGDVADGVSAYFQSLGEDAGSGAEPYQMSFEKDALLLESVDLTDGDGVPRSRFTPGDALRAVLRVRAVRDLETPFVSIEIQSKQQAVIYHEHNLFLQTFPPLKAGERATYTIEIPVRMTTGTYTAIIGVARGSDATRDAKHSGKDVALLADYQRLEFFVAGRGSAAGMVDFNAVFERAPL